MERAIVPYIKEDLPKKIVLLAGPRQVGKTTLARSLVSGAEYLNFDSAADRKIIRTLSWGRSGPLLILDELHKMKKWKDFLKGIFDTEGLSPPIIVTGSARLDVVRKMGDSLAGRHFLYTLHPLTLREINDQSKVEEHFYRLLRIGGFPEPFLNGSERFAARWRRSHLDIILRQDLLDLEQVRSIRNLELLIDLLRSRVGSTVSLHSLAEDLQVDHKTVHRWTEILTRLYIIFSVTPYTKNVARGLTKLRKFYFYDGGQVEGDDGSKLENMVACALLRECDWASDTQGREPSLHYVRDKDGNEIDFLVTEKGKVTLAAEVKWSDDAPARAFKRFAHLLPESVFQIVGELGRPREVGKGLHIVPAAHWLHQLTV